MSTKIRNHLSESKTSYSMEFQQQMINTGSLTNSLPVGSKKRLVGYQENLQKSTGINDPLFDDQVIDLTLKYGISSSSMVKELEYLNNLRDDDGNLFSRNLKIYSSTEDAMKGFAAKDHTSFRWNENYVRTLEEIRNEYRNMHLKPLTFHSDDEIMEALPKKDTHSGYLYLETGKKEKGDNIGGMYSYLKSRKIRIRKGLKDDVFPILLGFRTQASGEYTDEGERTYHCKHKTRLVSMCDLRDIVFDLQFAKPLQDAFSKKPWYAGGKNDKKIQYYLNAWAAKYPYFISLDYSMYDQSCNSWSLEDIFEAHRLAFDLTPKQHLEFDAYKDHFIHKYFITAEGIVKSDKGIVSGYLETNSLGSDHNRLVSGTYLNSKGFKFKMMTMGDDNIIFTDKPVDINDMASYIKKNFGMIINPDKSSQGKTRLDKIPFLSRVWTNHGSWRHPNQLLSRLAFPERFRNYRGNVTPAHVLLGYILTYPYGMDQLINVPKFRRDFPITDKEVFDLVDSHYIPGSLAYIREYTLFNAV